MRYDMKWQQKEAEAKTETEAIEILRLEAEVAVVKKVQRFFITAFDGTERGSLRLEIYLRESAEKIQKRKAKEEKKRSKEKKKTRD